MNSDGFLADVLDAPERLSALLDAYDEPGAPLREVEALAARCRRVLFVGMGSSRFAAITAATELRARGVDAYAELASTGLPSAPAGDTLVVGISASGSTPETVEALSRHADSGPTVAVTNDGGGELARAADVVLPLHAGAEAGGVACLTFQATVALLFLLVDRVTGAASGDVGLRQAVDLASELRASRGRWLDELVALLEGRRTVYAIAPAERLSSALQSALMLREGPRVPADATETGDWLHVDVYLSKHPGYRALLFTGSRFDAGVMEWARDRGAAIVAVGRAVEGAALVVPVETADRRLMALVEVGVAELAAARLWIEQAGRASAAPG